MQEILLIDKPKGVTSFDCIRILRKKLGVRNPSTGFRIKIGHAGTLDPMATGLMIIGVGSGTKKLQDFLKLDKTYEAEILLGLRTDTGDITGKVLEEMEARNEELGEEELEEALQGMVGKLSLPVPAYSAIKRGGEALYKKARRGEVVETPIKIMEIQHVKMLSVKDLRFKVYDLGIKEGVGELFSVVSATFDVTSGTYVRSLAEELGRRLGVPATLAGLRRTRIGEFKVEDAEKLTL